jgi:hypothetical protein
VINVLNPNSKNNNDKIIVCQTPPGNVGNKKTITVGAPAVAAHMAAGSCLGPCVNNPNGTVDCPVDACATTAGARLMQDPGTMIKNQAALIESFPNPFRETATIRFVIPETDNAVLTVYNSAGNVVAVLVDNKVEGGVLQSIEFDGSRFPNGMFVYQLKTSTEIYMGRMIMIK